MAIATQPAQQGPAAEQGEGLSAPSHSIVGGHSPIEIPEASLLFDADFVRSGNDLKLVGHDGQELHIVNYFGAGAPDLVAPNHAMLDGQTVTLLAGPQFPGQYAQAGGAAQAAEPIGSVETLQGTASAQRADGTTQELKVGDPIFESDVVTTGSGSNIGMKLADGTLVTLQESGKLAINDFVYSAGGTDNSALLNVIHGTFSLFAGQVAPTGDMKIKTPIATMGIRGTSILGVDVDAVLGRLSLTQDPDGHVGFIEIFNNQNGNLFTVLRTVFEKITISESGLLSLTPKTPEELSIDQTLTELLHNFSQQVPQQGPEDTRPQPQSGSNHFETPNIQEINFDPTPPDGPPETPELQLPSELLEQFVETLLQITEIRSEILQALAPPEAGRLIIGDQLEGSDVGAGAGEGGDTVATTLPFQFGAGGRGSVGFAALDNQPVRDPQGKPVTNGGVQLVYSWDPQTNTLTAVAPGAEGEPGEVVFTIVVNPTTGEVSVTINGAIDHFGANGEFVSVDIPFTVQAANGATATGTLTVGISDDIPYFSNPEGSAPGVSNAIVGEADIGGEQGDVATGTLKVDFGADGFGETVFTGAFAVPNAGSGVLAQGDLEGVDSGLTSNGEAILFRLSADGQTIEGYVAGENGGEVILRASLNKGDAGYEVELLGNIDHRPGANGQSINFTVAASDFDGDSIEVTLSAQVNDDNPEASVSDAKEIQEIYEAAAFVPTTVEGTLPFYAGADGATVTSVTYRFGGSIMDIDAPGGFPTFASKGVPVTVSTTTGDSGVITLTGMAGGSPVFNLVVNPDGSYSFVLEGPVDHPDAGQSGLSDALRMIFDFVVTDADGDISTSWVQIDIRDDAPALLDQPEHTESDVAEWEAIGDTETVDNHDGQAPTQGELMTLGRAAGSSQAEIETFLGLQNGELDTAGDGDATLGSAVRIALQVSAGDIISFDWNFSAHDYLPYDDFAFVVIDGELTKLADVGDFPSAGSGVPIDEATGWMTFTYTAQQDGVVELGLGVVNVNDDVLHSDLLIDNLQINGAPVEGAGIGEGGSLAVVSESEIDLIPAIQLLQDGNFEGGQDPGSDDLQAPSGAVASGEFNIDFGADGFGATSFTGVYEGPEGSDAPLERGGEGISSGLTSGGQDILLRLSADGQTIDGYIAGEEDAEEIVFTATLNDNNAGWSVALHRGVDHASELDTQSIRFTVAASDADGDIIKVPLTVNIVDGVPEIIEPSGSVLALSENDLSGGNETTSETLTATGDLSVSWGGDDSDNDGLGGIGGDRSLTFEASLDGATPAGLTSAGQQITYALGSGGTVLTASTSAGTVFTVALDDDGTGSYAFTLEGALDHPAPDADAITLDFGFAATDSDGDSATGSFSVAVTDGVPAIGGEASATNDTPLDQSSLSVGMATSFTPGNELLVNQFANGNQSEASVTALHDGGFVVTWVSEDQQQSADQSGTAVKARIFNAAGQEVVSEFVVNAVSNHHQYSPSVTALEGGGFVVTWHSFDQQQDASATAIKARIFDAAGQEVVSEFVVNEFTNNGQSFPSVTALEDGGFAVAWESLDQQQSADSTGTAIKARIFDAAGNEVVSEFVVNGIADNYQYSPSVTALEGGGFVATWYSYDQQQSDQSYTAIKARVFDATGEEVVAEFVVNEFANNYQSHPSVTALEGGGFVVTWYSYDQEQSEDQLGQAIKARIFNAAGEEVVSEFVVNEFAHNHQMHPSVTALEGGGFVVTWQSADQQQGEDQAGQAIKARIFDAMGEEIVSEFVVNQFPNGDQVYPSVAAIDGGGFVITWTSNDHQQSGDHVGTAIKARIFDAEGNDVSPISTTIDLNEAFDPDVVFGADGPAAGGGYSLKETSASEMFGEEGAFMVGGQQVEVTSDGMVLTGTAGGETAFTLTLGVGGVATYQQVLPFDVHEGQEQLQLDFGPYIVATDGDGDSLELGEGQFVITLNAGPDSANSTPAAVGNTAAVTTDNLLSNNIVLLIDTSASMGEPSNANFHQGSRLQLAQAAAINLAMAAGIAQILVVDFADDANASTWMSPEQAQSHIAGLEPGGQGSNVQAALDSVVGAHGDAGPADNTYVFVLSDGADPVLPGDLEAWKSWLAEEGIEEVFAYNLGADAQDVLDGLGWDSDYPSDVQPAHNMIVLDLPTTHYEIVTHPVLPHASGNVLENDDFGSDGIGGIVSVTIDGETHHSDANHEGQFGFMRPNGEEFYFFFSDQWEGDSFLGGGHVAGDWVYQAPAETPALPYKLVEYTIADANGDTSTSHLVIEIEPDAIQNIVIGTEESDVLTSSADLWAADVLVGGDSADTFVLNSFEVADFIADFNMEEGDTIDLTALLESYNQSNETSLSGEEFRQDHVSYDPGSGDLSVDSTVVANIGNQPSDVAIVIDDSNQTYNPYL